MHSSLRLIVRTAVCAAALPLALAAQTPAAKFVDSARVEIDKAVAASDAPRLAGALVLLDRALVVFPNDPYLLHYRGYATYRQALTMVMAGKIKDSGTLTARAISDLELSSDKLPWPESYALMVALTGFQIGADPSLGQKLGMQIGALSGKAMELGPNNPRVLLLAAEGLMNTPAEYGGGKEPAKAALDKAIALFANDHPAPLAPAWGKDEATGFAKYLNAPDVKKP